MSAIEVRDLRKEFNTPHGVEVAVDGISLSVGDNEFVTLVGPSGCGKTTCLRCIAGLETPTSGEVTLNGRDITDVPPNKRNLAMMFQSIALYPHMTVRQNIAYPLKVRGVPKPERQEPTEEVAELMQIKDMLDKHPGDLSGGQRQRCALARTVVQKPDGFLMDEPLSDLDAKLKVDIRKEIQRVHKRMDKPMVYVTHDQEEAMTMSDRIAVLHDGQIEQIGTPEEIFRQPDNLFVGQFIGNHGMNVMEGELVKATDSSVTLSFDGSELELEIDPQSLEDGSIPGEGSEVAFGFRPEKTQVKASKSNGMFTGQIDLLENVGDKYLASLSTSGHTLSALVDPGHGLGEGSSVSITFDRQGAHVFDLTTGDLLLRTAG